MGEILNRREQIIANKLPPEIPDPDTLVTKTDYATASKAGVVKIGNNINVSSGKISVPAASDETAGVVKIGANLSVDESGALNASGGITVEEIWSGNLTDSWLDITSALAHPLTDYKAIFFNVIPSTTACSGTGIIFVSTMPTGTNNTTSVYYGIGSTNHIDVRLGDETVSIKAGATVQGVHIFGMK